MKNVLSGLVLASVFVLTACGGGSSDSSAPTNTNNTNNPTTNPKPNPSPSTSPACEVKGTNIYVKEGSSCSYSNPTKGVNLSSITCQFQDPKRKNYIVSFKGKVSNIKPFSELNEYQTPGLISNNNTDLLANIAGISYICQ